MISLLRNEEVAGQLGVSPSEGIKVVLMESGEFSLAGLLLQKARWVPLCFLTSLTIWPFSPTCHVTQPESLSTELTHWGNPSTVALPSTVLTACTSSCLPLSFSTNLSLLCCYTLPQDLNLYNTYILFLASSDFYLFSSQWGHPSQKLQINPFIPYPSQCFIFLFSPIFFSYSCLSFTTRLCVP